MTGVGVMTILFIKDLPEIRISEIPPPEFCPIPEGLGVLGLPMNAAKCQGYSF